MDQVKANKIKKSIKQTKEKRRYQVPQVYQLKLQRLSKEDVEKFNRLFLEAKWLYNYVVADIENRLNDSAWKLKEVEIKTPKGFEKREIKILSSQMRQGILERIKYSLKSLKRAKEKEVKVGKLSFKSDVRSIPLKQYGMTYKLFGDKNRVKIQGIKKKFRALGFRQLPEECEIANGLLVKKPSGYYLYITCYLSREKVVEKIREKQVKQSVGIDLGIKHQLTLSTGEKIDWYVPETPRLKKLQRELARKVKGSRNYLKTRWKLQREWEYIYNKRQDVLNKAVSYLKRFSLIAVQNDSIKGWHQGWFGKQVQNTGIGGITARLKRLATLIPIVFVDRYEPTTQTCSFCGYKQKVELSERVFECQNCGKKIDRDINSARNILKAALKGLTDPLKSVLPVDCGEVKPVEWAEAHGEAGSLPTLVGGGGHKGEHVTVITKGKGYYGRTLAFIILPDGRNYNEREVADGYACVYKWHGHKSRELSWGEFEKLERLMEKAKEERKGLWGEYREIMECLCE